MSDDVTLTVNGERHEGWKSVQVRLSVEDIAGSFAVTYRDRWGERGDPFPIREGDEVAVSVEDELVITGYVDDYEVEYDAENVALKACGRSKAGDLVDCSEKFAPRVETTLLDIGQAICDPFGIGFSFGDAAVAADPAFQRPLQRFGVEPGETAFDALSRLVRYRGALLVSTPEGNVEVVRAGSTRVTQTVLQYGRNILRGSYSGSTRERFSKYTMLGQVPGDDRWQGKQMAVSVAVADDEHVPRYRPTVMMTDDAITFAELEKRVNFERNARAGRAERISYDVVGWTHAPGETSNLVGTTLGRAPSKVWRQNKLVKVTDDLLGVDDYLLIACVTLDRTLEGGKRARLDLCKPEAFDVLEVPEPCIKKRKRRRRRG